MQSVLDHYHTSMNAHQRHPHLGDEVPSGWVRVDCHSHTMWSGDATTTPDEMEEAVESCGIEVLCITDHGTIDGAMALRDRLACRVVVGQETRTSAGEVIGLFLTERIPPGLRPVEVAERIREQGGLVYIPHPFDPMRQCLRREDLLGLVGAGLVDAIEVFNAKTSLAHLNDEAASLARREGLPGGAGSDAHIAEAIGSGYVVMPDFDGPASFLQALSLGRVVGHHYDAARPWRARVVPSVTGSNSYPRPGPDAT